MVTAIITRPTRYRFSHQANGRYYWIGPRVPGSALEEHVSCSVTWFWQKGRGVK